MIRVPTPDVPDIRRFSRTLAEAYGPGARLAAQPSRFNRLLQASHRFAIACAAVFRPLA